MDPLKSSVTCLLLTVSAGVCADADFELRKGDRICYIGNTLADRMQHVGALEAYIQTRFPEHELVFRNLGFSADELTVRPRSMNFGDPHSHLSHSQADVVFAFFGYNESFAGEAGLDGFRKNLRNFIDDTRKQKYNGKSAPRLVVFSPIAHEDIKNPNLPDGSENNERLQLYTTAMAAVAREAGVPFVDLFTATRALYVESKTPLTLNGIHLTPEGNQQLGRAIDTALFGERPKVAPELLEAVREAVLTKNLRWFNRYRAVDGYSTYGKRAYLKFVKGQTNFTVMQHELKMLDVMTANRDKVIWAAAQGRKVAVDDSTVPAPIKVVSNVGGRSWGSSAAKEGSEAYLGGEEAIARMKVAKGMTVNLFASEEQFPELVNPVQSAVDTDGRLWVSAWTTYPHWHPNKPLNDRLLIFPDEDRDGRADKCIVFADGLHNPTGFEFWNGGVLVACMPDIFLLKDTDGDDKADVKIHYLNGIDSADTHCGANSFVLGPDGYIYFSEGIFHYTNVETPWGKPLRTKAPMLYRWNPRTGRIAEHFRISPNPHGIVIDEWGFLFATDGTSGNGFYVGYPGKGTPHQLYRKRVRPVAGFGQITGTHFPKENRGNLLICNTIGFLGVLQHKVTTTGADHVSREVEPVVVSSDKNFRPVDVELGGDGALYIVDWQNRIIGHMQHNIRDPSRDHKHGRIYRVTADGRPLTPAVKLAGKPIPEVIKHLASTEPMVRYRARIELSGRDSKAVLQAAGQWAAGLEDNAEDGHHLLEALWLHEQHNQADPGLLKRVLKSPRPLARAAGARVAGHWAKQYPDGVLLLQEAARDADARVRHEALVGAAQFDGLPAAEVMFEASLRATDPQIDYAMRETRKVVDGYWKAALEKGEKLSTAGQLFALRNADAAALARMERTEAVCLALLSRGSIKIDVRRDALQRLAGFTTKSRGEVLIGLIRKHSANPTAASSDLLELLGTLPGSELTAVKSDLESIAGAEGNAALRAAAIAGLIESGMAPDRVHALAATSAGGITAFLQAVPLVKTAVRRDALFPSVRPYFDGLPQRMKTDKAGSGALGRYVRVQLPVRESMTIAEVQVFSTGSNIAPHGKARQSSTNTGGLAPRAIDGRTNGNWRAGSCTHTQTENKPWWEVDLGQAVPIDKIVVWNRTDCCQQRLENFTLSVLNADRKVVFEKKGIPRPRPSVRIAVEGGDPSVMIQLAAMRAAEKTGGHAAEKFADAARLIRSGGNASAAVAMALSVPVADRPASRALLEAMIAHAAKLPRDKLLAPAMEAELAFIDQLAPKLSEADGSAVKSSLAALRKRLPEKIDPRIMAMGKEVYERESHCGTCHQKNGLGQVDTYPPLAGSKWVTDADTTRLIKISLHGLAGEIIVKGVKHANKAIPPMPPFKDLLKDEEIAAVLTYVRNQWGNHESAITASQVAAVRHSHSDRSQSWTVEEIKKQHPFPVEKQWVVYEGGDGPGKGKHVVFVSGDEEYRSEESLPQLGKILAVRHGFKCTVTFAIDPETGNINPDYKNNIPGLEALKTADLMIVNIRFRDLPADQMQHFDNYLKAGKPVLAIRPTLAGFVIRKHVEYAQYDWHYKGPEKGWHGGFGQAVLGQTWMAHHGKHRHQGTRGLIPASAKSHPIVRGIADGDIWGSTDVYRTPQPVPADWTVCVNGQVTDRKGPYERNQPHYGQRPDDPVTKNSKQNNPIMPIAWLRDYQVPGGKKGQCFYETIGASADFESEGLRRLTVNAAYHLLGMDVPAKAKVDRVGDFKPTPFGFSTYTKGVRPEEHVWPKPQAGAPAN